MLKRQKHTRKAQFVRYRHKSDTRKVINNLIFKLIFIPNATLLLPFLQYSRCVIGLIALAMLLLTFMASYIFLTPKVPFFHPSLSSSLHQPKTCSDPCK